MVGRGHEDRPAALAARARRRSRASFQTPMRHRQRDPSAPRDFARDRQMLRSIQLLLVPVLTAATFAAAASAAGETLSPSPGVSLALATQRAAQIRDLRYELALSIPERRSEPITGTNTLHFTLADPGALWSSTSIPGHPRAAGHSQRQGNRRQAGQRTYRHCARHPAARRSCGADRLHRRRCAPESQ